MKQKGGSTPLAASDQYAVPRMVAGGSKMADGAVCWADRRMAASVKHEVEGAKKMAKLYFYYSAMNAGKSTTLLQSAHNYEERGMRVLLFTSSLDDRYSSGEITSRIGLKSNAAVFDEDFDMFVHVRREHLHQPVSCVLVDEAQFLTAAHVLQLTLVCDKLNIPVLTYGIRTDFKGEPFEGSKYLLAWAEELCEIKTVCPTGKKATMNARLDPAGNRVWEGEQVDVGHHYMALSRKEFQLERVSPIRYQPPPLADEDRDPLAHDRQPNVKTTTPR